MKAQLLTAITATAIATVALAGCGSAPRTSPDAIPAEWRATRHAATATGDSAMVVSASPIATRVGVRVLRAGGNAVDASVAVAFALAVAYPTAGNLGGGGFIVARIGHESVALDFRETAPGKATRNMFLDAQGNVTDKSLTGALAAGVPGSVAGLWEIHKKYGHLPWRNVVAPAIALADSGFVADSAFCEDIPYVQKRLARFPASASLYLPNGVPLACGAHFKNPDLAATLRLIAAQGRDGFYKGRTAALVVAEMKRGGGIISLADLDGYRAEWRAPIEFTYRAHHVISMPPASSGGLTIALMANVLNGIDLRAMGFHSASSIAAIAGAERAAFARRNTLLGDPAFVKIDSTPFMSADTAAMLRAAIVRAEGEKRHTTHFSVVDAQGNAVSMTTTLNEGFGSAETVTGAGFLLNDEMDDFTTKVGVLNAMGLRQGEANAIQPGKRMLSSMTPTIVLDSTGAPWLITGASGGARIITGVAQTIINVVDYGMPLGDAASAPRFHAQDFPDSLLLERGGYDSTLVSALAARGEKPKFIRAWTGDLSWVQSIMRAGHAWQGVSEPRGNGLAEGY